MLSSSVWVFPKWCLRKISDLRVRSKYGPQTYVINKFTPRLTRFVALHFRRRPGGPARNHSMVSERTTPFALPRGTDAPVLFLRLSVDFGQLRWPLTARPCLVSENQCCVSAPRSKTSRATRKPLRLPLIRLPQHEVNLP